MRSRLETAHCYRIANGTIRRIPVTKTSHKPPGLVVAAAGMPHSVSIRATAPFAVIAEGAVREMYSSALMRPILIDPTLYPVGS